MPHTHLSSAAPHQNRRPRPVDPALQDKYYSMARPVQKDMLSVDLSFLPIFHCKTWLVGRFGAWLLPEEMVPRTLHSHDHTIDRLDITNHILRSRFKPGKTGPSRS